MLKALSLLLRGLLGFLPRTAADNARFEALSFIGRLLTPALRLKGEGPFYVNLGCGSTIHSRFINIDFFTSRGIDYGADLRYPLRIEDSSVDGIFCEHTLEHLTYAEGLRLLRECRRVLKPGGILRMAVPDLSIFIRSYCDGNKGWFEEWERLMFTESGDAERVARRLSTPLEAISFVTQEYGHVSSWDMETAIAYLRKAGFFEITPQRFRSGVCPALLIDLDSADRKFVSLYVEARK